MNPDTLAVIITLCPFIAIGLLVLACVAGNVLRKK